MVLERSILMKTTYMDLTTKTSKSLLSSIDSTFEE